MERDGTGLYTTTYDALSRDLCATLPGDLRTTFGYDVVGNPTVVNSPEGRYTTTYDAASRKIRVLNPQGRRTTLVNDPVGRRTVEYFFNTTRVSFTYDNGDRTTRIAHLKSDGTTILAMNYRNDKTINPVNVRESDDGRAGYSNTTIYDAADRPKATIDPLMLRTTTLDAAGQVTQTKNPLGQRTTYVYDPAGQSNLMRDPRGNRISTTFDLVGRVELRKYSDGTRTTFGYDPTGNRVKMLDVTGRSTFVYDPRSQLDMATNPAGKQIGYGYDALMRRRSMLDPDGGRFTYQYDAASRPTVVVNPQLARTLSG